MARKAKAASRAAALEYFKYNPETDGDQTFNIELALNQNWDKTKAEFERLAAELENIDISGPIGTHDKSSTAHQDIRTLIATLRNDVTGKGFLGNATPATDCNNMTTTGFYSGYNIPNSPKTGMYYLFIVIAWDATTQLQIAYGFGSAFDTRYRWHTVTGWQEWKNPSDGGNADTLDGKHASDFRPSTWTPTKNDLGLGSVPNVGFLAGQVLEVGQYIDFHQAGSNVDYDCRLSSQNQTLVFNSPIYQSIDIPWEIMNLKSNMRTGLEVAKYRQITGMQVSPSTVRGTVLISSPTGLDILSWADSTTNGGMSVTIENGGKVYCLGYSTFSDYPGGILLAKPSASGQMHMPISFTGNTVVKAYFNYSTYHITFGLK